MCNQGLAPISDEIVLGIGDAHLVHLASPHYLIHPQALTAFNRLAESAQRAGFCMAVASSYRSFARQLVIWNGKATGVRPLLDANGQSLNVAQLTQKEILFAVLRWSAIPGASRHHWGTDIDVYDSAHINENYVLQLTLEETQGDGSFAEFHRWLTEELESNSQGFYRPYQKDIGGVAPEPWHLSYKPIAQQYSQLLTEDLLLNHIQSIDIALKDVLLEHFNEIYQRFIKPYC